MIVIAIICILAALAISAYQTYTVRMQISEGIGFAAAAKGAVVDAHTKNGVPPVGRVEAGMTADATSTHGSYVIQVDVVNGRIDVTFGNAAHAEIQGDTLSLTPYLTVANEVAWRCGNAAPPPGDPLSGGGIAATHLAPTVDPRYLPSVCR